MYMATRMVCIGLAASISVALLAYASPASAAPPMSNIGLQQFTQRQNESRSPDVGKVLPASITALDASNKQIAVSDALRGPAVVIKTADGCPPCSALLGYVQAHGSQYMRANHASIVVLTIMSAQAPAGAAYPAGITALHTPGIPQGMLGGANLPAMYFFDGHARLLGERSGVYNASDAAMAAALSFPGRATN